MSTYDDPTPTTVEEAVACLDALMEPIDPESKKSNTPAVRGLATLACYLHTHIGGDLLQAFAKASLDWLAITVAKDAQRALLARERLQVDPERN